MNLRILLKYNMLRDIGHAVLDNITRMSCISHFPPLAEVGIFWNLCVLYS